jgi:hypothetical protein
MGLFLASNGTRLCPSSRRASLWLMTKQWKAQTLRTSHPCVCCGWHHNKRAFPFLVAMGNAEIGLLWVKQGRVDMSSHIAFRSALDNKLVTLDVSYQETIESLKRRLRVRRHTCVVCCCVCTRAVNDSMNEHSNCSSICPCLQASRLVFEGKQLLDTDVVQEAGLLTGSGAVLQSATGHPSFVLPNDRPFPCAVVYYIPDSGSRDASLSVPVPATPSAVGAPATVTLMFKFITAAVTSLPCCVSETMGSIRARLQVRITVNFRCSP